MAKTLAIHICLCRTRVSLSLSTPAIEEHVGGSGLHAVGLDAGDVRVVVAVPGALAVAGVGRVVPAAVPAVVVADRVQVIHGRHLLRAVQQPDERNPFTVSMKCTTLREAPPCKQTVAQHPCNCMLKMPILSMSVPRVPYLPCLRLHWFWTPSGQTRRELFSWDGGPWQLSAMQASQHL